MIRIVAENLLLFFTPTLLYLGYMWLTRDPAAAGTGLLEEAPLAWLGAAGTAIVFATILMFGTTSGGSPDQGYEPPTMKDGKLIPGHRQ